MKKPFYHRKKFWIGSLLLLLGVPLILFAIALVYVAQNQDEIVQTELDAINQGHQGKILLGATHLAPFQNFPYISIKVDDVQIFEYKTEDSPLILEVADIYIGLDLSDLISGNIDIKKLLIEDGFFDIVLHEDGTNNLVNALATDGDSSSAEPLHVHLQSIELKNIDIHKKDESTGLDIETLIHSAKGGFKSSPNHLAAHLDADFELNIIKQGDTTYFKHKQFELHTDLDLDESSGLLTIAPSGLRMGKADFELAGTIDTKNKMDLDLELKGTKPNFDLFVAFAPEEIIPVLERYKNAGKIYFNAKLQGPSAFGYDPFFEVNFGASEAFLENTIFGRRVDEMGFEGHFTNGEKRTTETIEFAMKNMTANLEEGKFVGGVQVNNFDAPEIDMQLDAQFNLNFIAEFLNLEDYQNIEGSVDLKMNFHDVINIDNPQEALNNLNQAYYTELKIQDFRVDANQLAAPIEKLNAHLLMQGKKAVLDQLEIQMGNSDLSIKGYLSDLPAVIHHTETPIKAHLDIRSKVLDVAELTEFNTQDSSGVDERLEDLRLALSFESTAKQLSEAKHLPVGEFFVDSFHAQLKHYPHELHDFHIDVLIDEHNLRIQDFTGFIDQSDFHLDGEVHEYAFWLKDTLNGDVEVDLSLESERLRLEDIFAYQGENYVPKDYRHEEFDQLKLHLNSQMHYQNSVLQSIDVDLDQFDTKMKLHPMRFQDFNGRIHYEDDHLMLENFHAQMGRSIFNVNLNYYLGEDASLRKKDNVLSLKTNYIDFDQLTNFNLEEESSAKAKAVSTSTANVSTHEEAYNLYELPFTDMRFDLAVGHFIHHRLDLQDIQAELRTTADHYIYVDTFSMKGAGGEFRMNGYFNGSDPKHIYLKPNLQVENVNLDQLLFKFENFGQDVIISENLHGQISANVTGNIRIYPDFVPDLDQSEVHLDVVALNGRLENFEYMQMLSDYFGDKDLNNVRFDTLKNHIDVNQGVITIPNMTIESTLGHMDISGKQDMQDNIEYFVRIPWKLIKQGARNRVFGTKKKEGEEISEDQIVELDPNEKVRYLNLKISGTVDDFKVRPGKERKKK